MEDFGLVEADFQQYYHLNLETMYFSMLNEGHGFLRYSRLFENLPSDSRVMKKLVPSGSWSWNDETMSRILHELSEIRVITFNSKRRKGQKALKSDKQFQPEYVEKAKDEYIQWHKKQQSNPDNVEAMRAFWQARNPDVKIL